MQWVLGSSRNQQIQSEMTHRALELMAIPPDQTLFLMDIGCGSGLSGEILEELGHIWVGLDIAPSMLGPFPLLPYRPRLLTGVPNRGGPRATSRRGSVPARYWAGYGVPPRQLRWCYQVCPTTQTLKPSSHRPLLMWDCTQHIGPPMAFYVTYLITTGQSPSTPKSVLHGPLRLPAQSFAGSIPVLPRNRRPNPSHNIHRPPGGFRWWNRHRLPKLKKGEESVLGAHGWQWAVR